jgi:predicted dinucleotide-binding enzyme
MDIAIVGAGNVGRALAGGWHKAGHTITVAVRDPVGGKALELRAQGLRIVPMQEAAASAGVIVLAVPWGALASAVTSLGHSPTRSWWMRSIR